MAFFLKGSVTEIFTFALLPQGHTADLNFMVSKTSNCNYLKKSLLYSIYTVLDCKNTFYITLK